MPLDPTDSNVDTSYHASHEPGELVGLPVRKVVGFHLWEGWFTGLDYHPHPENPGESSDASHFFCSSLVLIEHSDGLIELNPLSLGYSP